MGSGPPATCRGTVISAAALCPPARRSAASSRSPAGGLPSRPFAQRLPREAHTLRVGIKAARRELPVSGAPAGRQDASGKETTAAAPEVAEDEAGAGVAWPTLVSLCTLSSVICTIDRAAMSVAIIPMSQEFSWPAQVQGAVSSAFFGGYTLTNFAGGYLTALLPTAALLGCGVVFWSAFTILTPASAATCSMPLLMGCRAAMGVSEGVAFPSYTALYARHVPKGRRSMAQALLYSGQQLGTILALLTAPKVIEVGGWPAIFYTFGSLGLFWAVAWAPTAMKLDAMASEHDSPSPSERPKRSLSERIAIPWGEIVKNRAAFSLAMAHCSCGYGLFIYQAWLPSFCAQQYGLSVDQAAALAIGPWLVKSVTTAAGGVAADAIIRRGILSRSHTRKVMQSVGSLLPAALLAGFATKPPDTVTEALVVLTVCFAALGLQGSGFGGNHADISPKYASAMFGVTNALASIVGTMGIYLTGTLLQWTHGEWGPCFAIISASYVAGCSFFVFWGSGEEQDFNKL